MLDAKPIIGSPDPLHISTSYVQRSNLPIRTGNRRPAHLANAFSKKVENHIHMLALYFLHYKFCRVHRTLGVTPAMAAGITDSVRDMEWLVGMMDAVAATPASRSKCGRSEAEGLKMARPRRSGADIVPYIGLPSPVYGMPLVGS